MCRDVRGWQAGEFHEFFLCLLLCVCLIIELCAALFAPLSLSDTNILAHLSYLDWPTVTGRNPSKSVGHRNIHKVFPVLAGRPTSSWHQNWPSLCTCHLDTVVHESESMCVVTVPSWIPQLLPHIESNSVGNTDCHPSHMSREVAWEIFYTSLTKQLHAPNPLWEAICTAQSVTWTWPANCKLLSDSLSHNERPTAWLLRSFWLLHFFMVKNALNWPRIYHYQDL